MQGKLGNMYNKKEEGIRWACNEETKPGDRSVDGELLLESEARKT